MRRNMEFTVSGRVVMTVKLNIEAETPQEAAKIFARQTDGRPHTVGSIEVRDMCELCGTGILNGDVYSRDEDGVCVCLACDQKHGGKGTEEWWRRQRELRERK